MRKTTASFTSLLILAACGASEEAAAPKLDLSAPVITADDIVTETARLNAFFEDVFNARVARSPMFQTQLGIRTNYDKWDDPSDAAAVIEIEAQRQAVADMKAQFDFDKLDDQGKLSWRLAEYQLDVAENAYAYRGHTYIFNQMFGVQSNIPAFLINQHKVASAEDAVAYIARLEGVPDFLAGHLENAQRAAENGIQPPKFVYDYIIEASENVIKGHPFSNDTAEAPSPLFDDIEAKLAALVENGQLSEADSAALLDQARDAMVNHVGPAYERLLEAFQTLKARTSDDDGVWKLPDGEAYYATRLAEMTTTQMSADEIHALGLAEMERIHGEMQAIMQKVGFEGTLQDFFHYMRTEPRFYKPNTDSGRAEYLAEATAIIDTMREALPQAFVTFPKADLTVKAVEPFREKSAGKAFYQRPAADGSRPGIYYANLYNTAEMPTYQMEALAYHEGIPGHHMQLAIAQELSGLPQFRKFARFTAYTEGWGLYSELLPKDMGFYTDPYSDFGRLAMELWRAARLVVDTGLHAKKWTRQEAIQYLIDNTPNNERDCQKAIDRYIVLPGQATAYKIGMLKIWELRERARNQLGEAFDIREYHDVVLRDGPLPLAILEEKVEAWITEKAV